MECSICCDKMIGGSTPDKSVITTMCGHLFHEKCIKDFIAKRLDENNARPQNQKVPAKCPLCNNNNLRPESLVKIHLSIDNSGINEQLLMTHIVELKSKMESNERKQTEMFEQLMASMATMSDTVKAFQHEKDALKKENEALKNGTEHVPKSDSAALKAKDYMIANLQKEINDMKNKRAETTREMNTIREQINVLKLAAKGEKPAPKPEPKAQAITLKFDDFSDTLIIN